jgi:hypothetical protein
MAGVSPHGTAPPTVPSGNTPVDTSVDLWLDRVQKALPDLSGRSQQALARLAQEDSWPELAHALFLAEEDRNSGSCSVVYKTAARGRCLLPALFLPALPLLECRLGWRMACTAGTAGKSRVPRSSLLHGKMKNGFRGSLNAIPASKKLLLLAREASLWSS